MTKPTIADRLHALATRWGILMPEVRDREWTKPTFAEPIAGEAAADRFRRLVERIANWTDAELEHVDAAQTRHIARVVIGGSDPTYPAFPPEDARDSGKSGRVAQSQPETSDHTAGVTETPGEAPTADWSDADARYVHRYGEPAGITHDLGTVTRDTLDPTAAEQRERFDAIAGQPRPSAGEIKQALEDMQEAEAWARTCADNNGDPDYHVVTITAAAGMIDRLGVHCIALEQERDELSATLRKVAEQAKPIDGTDLAELVQVARQWADRNGAPDRVYSRRDGAALMLRLVGALNDQARKIIGLTGDVRAAEQAHDALLPIVEALRPAPGQADSASDAYTAITAWVRRSADPGAAEWVKLASRLRWDLLEARKAGDVMRDELNTAHTYTESQWQRARNALFARYRDGDKPRVNVTTTTGEIVDLVAEALGLERAK